MGVSGTYQAPLRWGRIERRFSTPGCQNYVENVGKKVTLQRRAQPPGVGTAGRSTSLKTAESHQAVINVAILETTICCKGKQSESKMKLQSDLAGLS